MKKILLILLTIGFILQSTSQLWIVGSFMANREFIAKTSCENRNIPASSCNGTCQLKKKIKEDAEHQENKSNSKQKEVQLFFVHYFSLNACAQFQDSYQSNTFPKSANEALISEYSNAIFHPPSCIV